MFQCNGENIEKAKDNIPLHQTNNLDSTYIKNGDRYENSCEESSSLNEDISLASSTKVHEVSNGLNNEEHNKSTDKAKPSQKSDKLKSKLTLSDLPPIQVNKTRGTDILPSLYSKEFKDKSNLQELDKLFDMEVEYEEDFMCSGDELSLKSDYSKTNSIKLGSMEEPKSPSSEKSLVRKNLKQPKINQMISDNSKPANKTNITSDNKQENSSCSSISEILNASATE